MTGHKKLFVFDVDGTLISDQHEILPQTLAQIKRLSDLGHAVALATGRSYDRSIYYARQVGADIRLIANNGALTYDFAMDTHLVHAVLSADAIKYLVDTARKHGRELAWSYGRKSHFVYFGKDPKSEISDNLFFTAGVVHRSYENWDEVKHTLEHPHEVQQVTIKAEPGLISSLVSEVQNELRSVCEVAETSRVYIDVNGFGVNKWVAVQDLQKKLQIKNEHTYAFGDSPNDLLMVQNVGCGVAMGNAKDSVKQVAKHVIGNNNEPAIAEFLASIN